MGQPWGSELHTLAQFARRAGISEGRARALVSASPSGLPRPDRRDAGGKPLWWSATVDAWCARTGREVAGDALWLFTVGQAAAEPVELRREIADIPGRLPGLSRRCYVVVWDTPHGHVVYLTAVDGGNGGIAPFALSLVEPRWWTSTVVVIPAGPTWMPINREPMFDVYRLVPDAVAGPALGVVGDEPARRAVTTVRRWLAQITDPPAESTDEDSGREVGHHLRDDEVRDAEQRRARLAGGGRAEWVTSLDADQIAGPLGTRLPVWIAGTLSDANVRRTLAYQAGRTVTVPLSATSRYGPMEWNPGSLDRARTALNQAVDTRYPAGWAVLASDTRDSLDAMRTAAGATPDTGPGWYLAARPALPDVPVSIESRLRDASPVTDLDQVGQEITELREQISDLTVDDPLDPVYTEMLDLLRLQLSAQLYRQQRSRPGLRAVTDGETDTAALEAVLDRATTVPVSGPWSGPVVDEWLSSLSQVVDVPAELRQRRVRDLLDDQGLDDDEVRTIYQDRDARYVIVWTSEVGELHAQIEWPTSLDPVEHWTDRTVLAADHEDGATLLFALTPTADGGMTVDPFPLPRNHIGGGSFAYGYPGGTPTSTVQAIIRAALRRNWSEESGEVWDNPLWERLTTATGQLRLNWTDVTSSVRSSSHRS